MKKLPKEYAEEMLSLQTRLIKAHELIQRMIKLLQDFLEDNDEENKSK